MENQIHPTPRILCLHGFRTSAVILKKIIQKWPQTVLEKLDLVFLDAQFPARGRSDVEGSFDPPYYEWYQFTQGKYKNFEKCIEYIEDYMIKYGPFDGLLGFSQGAILSAGIPGMQAQGVAFTKVPKIKFVIIISGAKFYESGAPKQALMAYTSFIDCPSLHIIGEKDFLMKLGNALLESFVDPVVIRHPGGHYVPRLDEKGQGTVLNFIEKIQKIMLQKVGIATYLKASL